MYQRQEIFNIIELFTSQKLINFYTRIFDNLALSSLPDRVPSKFGPAGFSRHALFRAFIVMKCEKLGQVTDLKDFLENNLIIAQLYGFNILKPLPSYWVFQRFIKNLSNSYFKEIMKNQVNLLK
ncbi:transposase [Clostridium prolinivorans]|uniref:transposase n=1 Tax=Clostridium prolinivorans TaxID=2769420 RepID=UPI001D18AD35|nr:transposase [Clostridium prolinivorans]